MPSFAGCRFGGVRANYLHPSVFSAHDRSCGAPAVPSIETKLFVSFGSGSAACALRTVLKLRTILQYSGGFPDLGGTITARLPIFGIRAGTSQDRFCFNYVKYIYTRHDIVHGNIVCYLCNVHGIERAYRYNFIRIHLHLTA